MERHRWLIAPVALLGVILGVLVAGVPSRQLDPPLTVGAGDGLESPVTSTRRSVGTGDDARPGAPSTSTTTRPSTTVPTGPIPPYPGEPLVIGDSGPAVSQWQSRMQVRGWPSTPDGRYGAATARVARAFQRQKGLRVTGEVDLETWNAAWTAPLPDDTTAVSSES